jgi:hypothetical protein
MTSHESGIIAQTTRALNERKNIEADKPPY